MLVSRYAIFLSQSGLGLTSTAYYTNKSITNDPYLSAYLAFATTLFQQLGKYNDTAAAAAAMSVLAFEQQLAQIFVPQVLSHTWVACRTRAELFSCFHH